MPIYKIVSDSQYGELFPDLVAIGASLDDPSYFLEAASEARPMTSVWIEKEGLLEDKLLPGDISRTQNNHISLSEKAKRLLENKVQNIGELLPFSYKSNKWFALNLLNSIPAIESQSKMDEDGIVETISFLEKDTAGQLLWTSSFGYDGEIYCSDEFIELVRAADLTGLAFECLKT